MDLSARSSRPAPLTLSDDPAGALSRRTLLRAFGLTGLGAGAAWAVGATSASAGESVPVPVPGGTVDVRSYGAKGDGRTDDSKAFLAALASGASTVVVSPGTYLVSKSLWVPWNVTTFVVQTGARVVKTNPKPLVRRIGTCESTPRTVSGAVDGATVITVASATGIGPGTWVHLASDDWIKPNKSKRGALRQVVSVLGNQLTLDRPLNSDLQTRPRLHVVGLAPSLTVTGGGSLGFANPSKNRGNAIRYDYVADALVQGVEVSDCGDSGIVMMGVVGGLVDAYVHDCVDDEGLGCYGYGVELQSGTRDMTVQGTIERVRHSFTTNGAWNHQVESLDYTGEPECIVVRPVVRDTTSAGIDTHEPGYDITIIPDVTNPGTVRGSGIDIRCRNVKIVGGHITGARENGVLLKNASGETSILGTTISMGSPRWGSYDSFFGVYANSTVSVTNASIDGFGAGVGIGIATDQVGTVTGTRIDGGGAPGATALRVQGRDGTYVLQVAGCSEGVREIKPAQNNTFVVSTDGSPVTTSPTSGSHATQLAAPRSYSTLLRAGRSPARVLQP